MSQFTNGLVVGCDVYSSRRAVHVRRTGPRLVPGSTWSKSFPLELTRCFSLQVYYITCPEIIKSFTHFPTTPTGSEVTSIEQATGTCVPHAREESSPSFLCTGDGQWSLLGGGCACLPGYQANIQKQSCDGEYPS